MHLITNLKLYLIIFKEFFKIGIFSFGGGYATLPFLHNLTTHYNWFDLAELTKMVAVSAITPGPIGINMATYAGLKIDGILTAIIATTAEIIPAFFIVISSYKFIEKYKDNSIVKSILFALKPTSCALLVFVLFQLCFQNFFIASNFRYQSIIIFLIILAASFFKNFSAIYYMIMSVIIGYCLKLLF